MSHRICIGLLALSTGLAASPPLISAQPLVIGHRGASGYLPEHTLPAARVSAADQQALIAAANRILATL